VLITALGSWGDTGPPPCDSLVKREGDPQGRSTVLITALGSWGELVPHGHSLVIREGDPQGRSTLVTALGSWGESILRGHRVSNLSELALTKAA
jgi:hypothetical protein